MNHMAWNYNPSATYDDSSCIPDRVHGLDIRGEVVATQCLMVNCYEAATFSGCALNGQQRSYLSKYAPPTTGNATSPMPLLSSPPPPVASTGAGNTSNATSLPTTCDVNCYLCTEMLPLAVTPINASVQPVASVTFGLASNWCGGSLDSLGACILPKFGCLSPSAINFDSTATLSDTVRACPRAHCPRERAFKPKALAILSAHWSV
jgi:hypothetical protein